MFRKLRDDQRSHESHCEGDSSSWGCFDLEEGSAGCCPREGGHAVPRDVSVLAASSRPGIHSRRVSEWGAQ